MTRTRRVAVDDGTTGNDWYWGSGSLLPFPEEGYVQFVLPLQLYLGGRQDSYVNVATLWSNGVLSLGYATQAQIDFMGSGASPIPEGANPGFPGEFFLFDYDEGVEHGFYSFGMGIADFSAPFDYSDGVDAAFFTFESGFQIIIDAYGFSIISEGEPAATINGYYIGNYSDQTVGSAIEVANFPEFFTYSGTPGDDNTVGSYLDDLFASSAGADIIDGNDGLDVVSYFESAAGVTVNLVTGAGAGGDAAGDQLFNIEDVIGSSSPDTLTGNGANNQLSGNGGTDTIGGGGGNDYLFGGDGADSLNGGEGDDYVDGGGGADNLDGGAGNDYLGYGSSLSGVTVSLADSTATGGNSTGDTFQNFESVVGSFHNDLLQGSPADNELNGFGGNDVIFGFAGSDTLDGHQGDDFLEGGAGGDTIFGGGGNDTASYADSPAAVTINLATGALSGGDANGDTLSQINNIVGTAFGDSITGDILNNRLDGGPGSDLMAGGDGDDFYFVDNAGDLVTEGSDAGYDTVFISISYTLGANVERAVAYDPASTSALSFTGNGLANELSANAGANVIDGGAGADFMRGLGGNDIYFVDNAGDQVVEAPGGGFDTVFVSASYTLGAELERVLAYDPASTAGLSFTGNALDNEISANAGANVIDGAAGADFMSGQGGNDIYFVDNAGDYVLETAGNGFDTVFATASHTLTPEVERVFAYDPASTDALNFTGNALDNELGGTAGANILDGGLGADLMVGADGNDIYFVDNAGDVVSDSPTGGYDTVFASISFVLETRIERVVALDPNSTAALSFTGNAVANEITGNAGGNLINGGGGADILFGGAGGDAFLFNSALGGGNIAALPDFAVGSDRIYLDDAVFGALTTGALNPNAFRAGSAAADADDRIIYNSATGALLYDADGNGVGAAVQFATLHEGLAVTASDFQVV